MVMSLRHRISASTRTKTTTFRSTTRLRDATGSTEALRTEELYRSIKHLYKANKSIRPPSSHLLIRLSLLFSLQFSSAGPTCYFCITFPPRLASFRHSAVSIQFEKKHQVFNNVLSFFFFDRRFGLDGYRSDSPASASSTCSTSWCLSFFRSTGLRVSPHWSYTSSSSEKYLVSSVDGRTVSL